MRECPKCGSSYTDDSLQYCLQDGARLLKSLPDRPETETLIREQLTPERPETETLILPKLVVEQPETETFIRHPQAAELPPTENLPSTLASGRRPSKKTPAAIVAGLTALIGILVLPIAAVLVWTTVRKWRQSDRPGTTAKSPTPTLTSPTPGPTEQLVRREILSALYTWKRDMESKDVISLAADYAEKVDYYGINGASAQTVLRDKSETFSKYTSISIGIENETVYVSDIDETGSVECDKLWTFTGSETNTGNRRSQFKFRKLGGRWRITSEKDL